MTGPPPTADPVLGSKTFLGFSYTVFWLDLRWNPKMIALQQEESHRTGKPISYVDLVLRRKKRFDFLFNLYGALPPLESVQSADGILKPMQKAIRMELLRRELTPSAKAYLEEILTRRSREVPRALQRLTVPQAFYFWFCDAREAVTGRPNLPPAGLGDLFGDGRPTVQDHIQLARRALRGRVTDA